MRKPREVAPTGERAARQALRRFPRFPTETQVRVPLSVEMVALLEEAQSLAEKEGAEMTRIDHLGSALLRRQSQRPPSGLASLLAACGADLE
ncbi:MAG: hypothetical protein J2P45_20640, partial [Candidatus Dormibacteraeota bacterium]|nr:hypothetical protein [Candidatus Dormibacteraeota bacterium]